MTGHLRSQVSKKYNFKLFWASFVRVLRGLISWVASVHHLDKAHIMSFPTHIAQSNLSSSAQTNHFLGKFSLLLKSYSTVFPPDHSIRMRGFSPLCSSADTRLKRSFPGRFRSGKGQVELLLDWTTK